MFIKTVSPDKIPDCFLWYDFSDNGDLNDGTGKSPINGATISLVKNRMYQYLVDHVGLDVADASALQYYDGNFDAGYPPIWVATGINGKGSALFGTTIISQKYTNVLSTGYIINSDYSLSGNLYYGPLFDSERTIFMVYQPIGLTGLNNGVTSVDAFNTTFSGTQLYPKKFGCIFNISSVVNNYIDPIGITYSWQSLVSYMNLLKQWDNFTYSNFNYLPAQGFGSDEWGYPNNDYNQYTPINDGGTVGGNFEGKPTLFSVRCNDNRNSIENNSYSEVISEGDIKNNSGTICTTDGLNDSYPSVPDTWTPPNSFKGIWGGVLSLGSSSRFYGEVPTSTGMQSGITIPYVNPTKQCGFSGYIGEFIYYSRKLTDAEYSQVLNYLNKKWNL